jgi:hypothetical protein
MQQLATSSDSSISVPKLSLPGVIPARRATCLPAVESSWCIAVAPWSARLRMPADLTDPAIQAEGNKC